MIFEKHGINYAFEDVPPDHFVEDIGIEFKLLKKSTGKRIDFANLSSGEKKIIALIVKLFTSDFYKQNLELPELIVLDEPDSYLHPELAKLLIEVLNESFVKKLGVKVIITTHSPSTVALTPEDSLFELKNEPTTSLRKVSKDEALKILTFGVPTLSIDYKNHRQVFVESPTDVFYYQSIYDVLSSNEKLLYRPYFISCTKGKGNSDQVIEMVNSLRKAGNDKVYGIIDWDGKHEYNDSVFVHGAKNYYSIENFIYSPVYLAVYFLGINGAENIFEELGFSGTYNQYTLGPSEDNERLQKVCNWVIDKITKKFPALNSNETTEVRYLNNKTVVLPDWFLKTNGHELEVKLKKVFPSLEGKFRSEGSMQEELTKVVVKSYPFLPLHSVKLIRDLTS